MAETTATKLYRITHGKYHRMEGSTMKVYRANSTVELTHGEALNMRHQIEPARPTLDEELAGDGETGNGEGEAGSIKPSAPILSTESYAYLADLTAEDAIAVVNGLATAEEVQSAIDAEVKGKNRKSVIAAAKDRLT